MCRLVTITCASSSSTTRALTLRHSCSSWFTVFDLKSGHHHVEIHSDSWQYLGFSFTQGEKRAYYEFQVLPFGLSTACYIFMKLLRPLVRCWRSSGLMIVLYIDGIYIAVTCGEQHSRSDRRPMGLYPTARSQF